MSATDAAFLRSIGSGPPVDPRIVELDLRIDGLREARRILAEGQSVARWRWWADKKSSRYAVHAIASARERIGRELKRLKAERAQLAEPAWMP